MRNEGHPPAIIPVNDAGLSVPRRTDQSMAPDFPHPRDQSLSGRPSAEPVVRPSDDVAGQHRDASARRCPVQAQAGDPPATTDRFLQRAIPKAWPILYQASDIVVMIRWRQKRLYPVHHIGRQSRLGSFALTGVPGIEMASDPRRRVLDALQHGIDERPVLIESLCHDGIRTKIEHQWKRVWWPAEKIGRAHV